jgi:hypothetical protein
MELGETAVCGIRFFAAEHAAALAIQNIFNNFKKFLVPIGVIALKVKALEVV